MKSLNIFGFILLCCTQLMACNHSKSIKTEEDSIPSKNINKEYMKLKITIGDNIASAVLYDNPASRDFAALLPLTLELEEYANTEKIANLSKKLNTTNEPKGFDPSVGDICYYAPWGNMCIFYRDFDYSTGLVSLGKITEGMEYFNVKGNVNVTIELIQ